MASDFQDFWADPRNRNETYGGMFDLGVGLYGMRQSRREAEDKLRRAQGPLYNEFMQGAGTALGRAGSMDPKAAAAERFAAQRGLLSGVDAKSEADLMQMLAGKGLLGLSTYNPGVEGIAPSGTAMNPQMAAFYAARNARDARMSADALDAGEGQIDRMLNRAGLLQRGATGLQESGLRAQDTQPSRTLQNLALLKGTSGLLKDTGLFGTGVDWLKGTGSSIFKNIWNSPVASGPNWGDTMEWF